MRRLSRSTSAMTATASRLNNGEKPGSGPDTSACSECASVSLSWEDFAKSRASLEKARLSASSSRASGCVSKTRLGSAGGTGERVAREPLTGRVARERSPVVGSGPVGERVTPTALRAQGPLPLGQDPLRYEFANTQAVSRRAAVLALRASRV